MSDSSASRNFEIPELIEWLARLGGDSSVVDRFIANPLTFASWYTLLGESLPWPDDVKAIQKTERERELSFELAASLLKQVNYAMGEHGDVEHARSILEGYGVHRWVTTAPDTFRAFMSETAELFGNTGRQVQPVRNGMAARTRALATALELNKTETQVLQLALACTSSREIRSLFEQLVKSRRSDAGSLWSGMLQCEPEELRAALSSQGILRKSRLLSASTDTVRMPLVSLFWLDRLTDTLEPFFDSLLKPLVPKPGAGIPARILPEDLSLAAQVLVNAQDMGVNLLFYGAEGLEKRVLLDELIHKGEKQGFILQHHEKAYGDWSTIAFVAQRLLFQRHGRAAVLVIEKPSEVLERKPSEFMKAIFGIEVDSSRIAPMDELLLETNPGATIWAGPGTEQLSEECIARFVFHAPLKKARRAERRQQLEMYVADMKLNKSTKTELLALEDVSARQLETALRASRMSGATTKAGKEAALVQAVKRSLLALRRDVAPPSKECVTAYSLKYLNYSGRFGPEQLLKAFKLRPKGSVCLYGPPGTGKTQFVEHLAEQLGIRLIVKRASDLLSKWVGDNEKNIAEMFQEAENEEAILFLDEGDSFLSDRRKAQAGWEVTKVNELLQKMERFEGIFIVATNLFKGLDTAALRRFTFKLEFKALSNNQRWDMFVAETGLFGKLGEQSKDARDKWREALYMMPQLAAGDFATVKRQSILLGETLSPSEWIDQLQLECKVKLDGDDESAVRME